MTNKNKYIKIISSTLLAGAFFIIAVGCGNSKENNNSSSQANSPSFSEDNNNSDKSNSTAYDRNTVYEAGNEDFTNTLKGGIILTPSEARLLFDVRFPDGTEKDHKNYVDGFNNAVINNMSLINEIKNRN